MLAACLLLPPLQVPLCLCLQKAAYMQACCLPALPPAGYFKVSVDNNACGVTTDAVYAVVDEAAADL